MEVLTMTQDALRKQIGELARQYSQEAFRPRDFEPGVTVIPPSGKVIDGAEVSYDSVRRFLRKLGWMRPLPFRRLECAPGQEAQVDFGTGAPIVGAEAVLASPKPTKKAANDQRIATDKISRAQRDIDDLVRTELLDRDNRMYPGNYVPVLVAEGDGYAVKPMRYQCRPAGKPASYDTRFPGTYNARRDNLEGFWKGQFGHAHALMVVNVFYENVEGPDGKNQVLRFEPRTGEPMYVACLWSHWTDPAGKEPDLLSFAAITDEPEPEVAAAGHDRTIINIKPEHIEAWLNPDQSNLAALYAIFDDKQHPFYEHQRQAA